MAVRVVDCNGIVYEIAEGIGFSTEEEHNNLEIYGPDGRITAAFAGTKWTMAEVDR